MPLPRDAWRRVMDQPLDYLHPQRLRLPAHLDSAALRSALNPVLVKGLQLPDASMDMLAEMPWIAPWVEHWQRLPEVAHLLGAYLQWPHLARGAGYQHLSASQRAFAACELGPRHPRPLAQAVPVRLRLEAVGLGALGAWQAKLPPALNQRLALLFSPQAEAMQPQLPGFAPDSQLFILAVQHARCA